ncbi:MAG: M1 family metallopeptidase, partial [Mameliella sp.]|nr:M1 family metallopeptidase [Phaeodactylibacter sp.]
MKIWHSFFICFLVIASLQAQPDRWQQSAKYTMDIDFDVAKHQYNGKQTLVYTNNSPDTLHQVFYHLFFNAFQPNSMMDIRSQNMNDADPRVGSRIGSLGPNEIGYHKINSLTMDGKAVDFEVVGTILEVQLPMPILPQSKVVFEMAYESQVPVQIRRSGRDNAEGISYSMTQWYPKMCEYDYQGWHANPYVGREFHGIWGAFDVTIHIDSKYTIGGSGYLQNPKEIGHGYTSKAVKVKNGKKLSWHFVAPDVHDFAWGADPDYKHTSLKRKDGVVMHFFYQENEQTKENWEALPAIMDEAFEFINKHYGQYPYQQYSFVQGGDGGMEYPMATLITGERSLPSLVGVSVNELIHS